MRGRYKRKYVLTGYLSPGELLLELGSPGHLVQPHEGCVAEGVAVELYG